MITKRLVYGPIERIESAIARLNLIAERPYNAHAADIRAVIARDLREATEQLQYVSDLAE